MTRAGRLSCGTGCVDAEPVYRVTGAASVSLT